MATATTTKPSTRKLSDAARHVFVPKSAVSTGWPAVERKASELGVGFRWWQKPIGKIILAKDAAGKYATTVGGTGLSIPRQVGKTFLVGVIVFVLCLLRPKLTVIWTAHRVRTAEETFGKMQAFAKRKRIAPHIANIVLGSGEEEITFRNGSRILFGARARGFGRGFDEVDVLIFDEAQILTEAALDDMVPATNQSRQPEGALMLFMGTPPKTEQGQGEVFTRMREEALTGEDEDTAWIEFGADEDWEPTPLPAPLSDEDWAQIAKANPSFPDDTPREAILRMRKKLGPDSFVREGAGRWDKPDGKSILPKWAHCAVDGKDLPAVTAIGLGVSLDGNTGSIASARVWGDGRVNLGGVERRPGSTWLVAEAKRIQDERGCRVGLDEKCPDAQLHSALVDAGVNVQLMKLADYVETCSDLVNRVKEKRITHQSTTELDAAVAAAKWRPVGDGRKVFGRKVSAGDIDMLEGATAALWAAGLDVDPWEAWT